LVEGAALLPFDPPILWDEDTSLWDFVLEQGRSGIEPQQEMIALKEEISTNTSLHFLSCSSQLKIEVIFDL
jgi:hypothetical protein